MKVNLTQQDFSWAVKEELITDRQSSKLWTEFSSRQESVPQFRFLHVSYYTGTLLIILAFSWYVNNAWEELGGRGLLIIASVGFSVCLYLGFFFWYQKNLEIPGGLLTSAALCFVPLAVYGLQVSLGTLPQNVVYHDFHVYVHNSWFFMEIATIGIGLFLLRFIPVTFVTMPIAFSMWHLSMDLTPVLFSLEEMTLQNRSDVSLLFGFALIILGINVDQVSKRDYSFWIHLFGGLAFWFGLLFGERESKFINFLINLGFCAFSIVIQRYIFMILGVVGVMKYLGYLAFEIFEDTLAFSLFLALTGFLIIYVVYQYQSNEAKIQSILRQFQLEWFSKK